MLRPSKQRKDYYVRLLKICDALGCSVEAFPGVLRRMYLDENMSCDEMAQVFSKTEPITARTVSRWLRYIGVKIRTQGDAFRLAASRGRVVWHMKDPALLTRYKRVGGASGAKMRYMVMRRDNFSCVLCGSTAKEAPLEIDHMLAIVNGGTNSLDNLRTLCHACNLGKAITENEK